MFEDDFWLRWLRRRALWPFNGGLIFGDFEDYIKEMENLLTRELDELITNVPKELIRERTLPSGTKVKEWGPFVYGYSMSMGPEGKPQIREFGNIRPGTRMGKPRLEIKEKREPLADVITFSNKVQIAIELPGVEKKDIKLKGTDDSLVVSVETPQRKYFKKILIPTRVDLKTAKSSYKNGVLAVTIQRITEEKSEGETLKIE